MGRVIPISSHPEPCPRAMWSLSSNHSTSRGCVHAGWLRKYIPTIRQRGDIRGEEVITKGIVKRTTEKNTEKRGRNRMSPLRNISTTVTTSKRAMNQKLNTIRHGAESSRYYTERTTNSRKRKSPLLFLLTVLSAVIWPLSLSRWYFRGGSPVLTLCSTPTMCTSPPLAAVTGN